MYFVEMKLYNYFSFHWGHGCSSVVSVVYCQVEVCDELITRPEESYRLWYFVVCDLENLKNEEAMARVGSQRHRKKILSYL
jgi:hypothetical protein